MPQTILVQTTVRTGAPGTIAAFSRLREHLTALRDDGGAPCYEIIGRDRMPNAEGEDPLLGALDRSPFAQLWLLASDGGSLSATDARGIMAFRRRGGGVATACDPGGAATLATLPLGTLAAVHAGGGVAASGSDGDYQRVEPARPVHPLLRSLKAPDGVIRWFPAHARECVLREIAPHARGLGFGNDARTGAPLAVAVAIEGERDAGRALGRAACESAAFHLSDAAWDPRGAEGERASGIADDPRPLEMFKDFVANLAAWLGGVRARSA